MYPEITISETYIGVCISENAETIYITNLSDVYRQLLGAIADKDWSLVNFLIVNSSEEDRTYLLHVDPISSRAELEAEWLDSLVKQQSRRQPVEPETATLDNTLNELAAEFFDEEDLMDNVQAFVNGHVLLFDDESESDVAVLGPVSICMIDAVTNGVITSYSSIEEASQLTGFTEEIITACCDNFPTVQTRLYKWNRCAGVADSKKMTDDEGLEAPEPLEPVGARFRPEDFETWEADEEAMFDPEDRHLS